MPEAGARATATSARGCRTRAPTARRRGSSAGTSATVGILSLESAIAKLTSVPADRIGLRGRGVLRQKAFADVVVFDPSTVGDLATELDPHRYPAGIEHVIVNGVQAIADGVETDQRPGRLLRRER